MRVLSGSRQDLFREQTVSKLELAHELVYLKEENRHPIAKGAQKARWPSKTSRDLLEEWSSHSTLRLIGRPIR